MNNNVSKFFTIPPLDMIDSQSIYLSMIDFNETQHFENNKWLMCRQKKLRNKFIPVWLGGKKTPVVLDIKIPFVIAWKFERFNFCLNWLLVCAHTNAVDNNFVILFTCKTHPSQSIKGVNVQVSTGLHYRKTEIHLWRQNESINKIQRHFLIPDRHFCDRHFLYWKRHAIFIYFKNRQQFIPCSKKQKQDLKTSIKYLGIAISCHRFAEYRYWSLYKEKKYIHSNWKKINVWKLYRIQFDCQFSWRTN